MEGKKQQRDRFGVEKCASAPKHQRTDYSLVSNLAGLHHASPYLEPWAHHTTRTEGMAFPRDTVSLYLHVESVLRVTINLMMNFITRGC